MGDMKNEEDEEAKMMASLGLPNTFGKGKARSRAQKRPKVEVPEQSADKRSDTAQTGRPEGPDGKVTENIQKHSGKATAAHGPPRDRSHAPQSTLKWFQPSMLEDPWKALRQAQQAKN